MSPNSDPSFRDLYEVQEKVDGKIEKLSDRLSRLEKGLIVLTLLILAPKLGAPDASQLVASAIQFLV